VVSLCRSRNLLPLPSSYEEFQGPKEGLRPQETVSNTVLDSRRKQFAKATNLGFLYVPRTTLSTFHKVGEKEYLHTSSTKSGLVVGSSLLFNPEFKIPEKPKFKTLTISGVSHYYRRVQLLQFLSHIIAKNGLCKKSYKTLKRLNLVAFTCHLRHLKKMIRKITGDCNYRYDKLATQPVHVHKGIPPQLLEETKSVKRLNGIHVHCWTWRRPVREVWTSGEPDEEMW